MVEVFEVGGAVRDEILGVQNKDRDFAVEASSYEEMRDYIAAIGTIYLEKPEFFTIRAKVKGVDADFVLCRKEYGYSDGRRPDRVEVGTIEDDLARRDFTMNAIAKDEAGNYRDPFCGRTDIERKLIRCVGCPEDRFGEDALRMIRAVRFAITKPGFQLDQGIQWCLHNPDFVDKIDSVSPERVREELNRCLRHDTPGTMLLLFRVYTLLGSRLFDGRLWLKATLEDR